MRRAFMRTTSPAVSAAVVAAALLGASPFHLGAQAPTADPLAARLDPWVEKQRVIVMTDIANEPDDQMSMVRLLVYARTTGVHRSRRTEESSFQ